MSSFKDRETNRRRPVVANMISKETIRAAQGSATPDKETKKRYNLVILPSVYEDMQKIAYVERRSVSEIAGELFADYVKARADKLAAYDSEKQ